MIQEGSIKLDFETPKKVSKDLDVFYNPVMKLNRDISIEVLKIAGKRRPLRIALPLSGSGIRGLRFLKEASEFVENISFNDYAPGFKDRLTLLLKQNKIPKTKVKIFEKEANVFLRESIGYDYIGLDPFGTPNPFLDSAVQRLARDGILAITATDTSAMAGTYPKVCKRNYDATPLRNWLKHFVGIRILARKVQLVGAQYEKALVPIFSYSKDHYYRIFFVCKKSKTKCDDIISEHKYLLYCNECLNYEFSKFNSCKCSCGKEYSHFAGPLWSGNLWADGYDSLDSEIKHLDEEINTEGSLIDIHELASKNASSVPNYSFIEDELRKKGFSYSRSHFSPNIIKSDANSQLIFSLFIKKKA